MPDHDTRERDEFLRGVVAELSQENVRWPGLWTRLDSLLRERDALAARVAALEHVEEIAQAYLALAARIAALEHALPLLGELVEVCERGYFSGRWRWHLDEAREKFDAVRDALAKADNP